MRILPSVKAVQCLALSTVFYSFALQAEVHEYSFCKLKEGKTPADAVESFEAFGKWAAKNSKMPRPAIRELMWEFYRDEAGDSDFVMHLAWKDFTRLGDALNKRWDLGGFQKEPENNTFECTGSRIFWTVPD